MRVTATNDSESEGKGGVLATPHLYTIPYNVSLIDSLLLI